jgi:uncharacterized protein with gpF-like domain
MCNHTQQLKTKQELSGREFDNKRLRDERTWVRSIKSLFAQQKRSLLNAVKESSTPISILDEIPKYINTRDTRKLYKELYTKQGQKYYNGTIRALQKNSVYRFNLKEIVNEDDLYWLQMSEFVDNEVASRIISVTDTSQEVARKAINEAVTTGVNEGQSIPQIKAAINASVNQEWRIMTAFRPELIARTESLTMANYASFLGAESLGEDLDKVWLAFIDGRTRQAHITADRQVAPMQGAFIVGGEQMRYPGDTWGSARNVCNCRCTIIYQTKDERNY